MCGIVCYIAKDPRYSVLTSHIALVQSALHSRGPDFLSLQVSNDSRILVANSILSVNQHLGGYTFPSLESDEFYAYNGEIYHSEGYSVLSGLSDTHYLLKQLRSSRSLESCLYESAFRGCFAFVYVNKGEDGEVSIKYGVDFFGERNLFAYEDDRRLILSSIPALCLELASIHENVKPGLNRAFLSSYIRSRNLLDSPGSFVDQVTPIPPGSLVQVSLLSNGKKIYKSYDSWHPDSLLSLLRRTEKHDSLHPISSLHFSSPLSASAALIVSGGVDSSLVASEAIANRHQNDTAITLTFGSQDLVALQAPALVEQLNIYPHLMHDVSVGCFAQSMQQCYELLLCPLPTHSYASALILGQVAAESGSRILFGGDGADELHLGYPQYLSSFIQKDFSSIASPYSSFEMDSEYQSLGLQHLFSDADPLLETRSAIRAAYFNLLCSLNIPEVDAAIKSTLIMDIRYNMHSTGLLAGDLIVSSVSIESRSPFVFIGSFLNLLLSTLPLQSNICKPYLQKLFINTFRRPPFQKMGFSGFPNESGALLLSEFGLSGLPYLAELYDFNFMSVFPFMSRRAQWKMINSELFLYRLSSSR
jgi:asparagine synthetase B (glutamine-hydrolysing)